MKPHLYKSQITMFSLLLSILLIISSCGNKTKTAQKEKTGSDTPPSLSGVKPENLVKLSEKELAELKIQVLPVTSSFQKYNIAVPGVVFPAPNHSASSAHRLTGGLARLRFRKVNLSGRGRNCSASRVSNLATWFPNIYRQFPKKLFKLHASSGLNSWLNKPSVPKVNSIVQDPIFSAPKHQSSQPSRNSKP